MVAQRVKRSVDLRCRAGIFVVVVPLLLATPLLAKDFAVDTVLDLQDGNPGDGVCAGVTGPPNCSLRAAVQEANALGGVHTITLPEGTYHLTIGPADDGLPAASGDLAIKDSNVTVCGAGADTTIIDGNKRDRVFHVFTGATLVLCDVTIRNGQTDGNGGGILNLGTLHVTHAVIAWNSAQGVGGGIVNGGELKILRSAVSNNSAENSGGVFNNGTATIQESVVARNSGGGIANLSGAEISITRTTVSGNYSGDDLGIGGVSNFGTATIVSSTISGNAAHGGGGVRNGADLTIINSTISGNKDVGGCFSDSCGGGGLFVSPSGSTAIINSTIVKNRASASSSVATGGIENLGSVTIKNSIVADNRSSNGEANCGFTPITSIGHNLESSNTCGFSALGDLVNVQPHLGPLADNGGPTRTHALLRASPAIDAAAGCPSSDQRGLHRWAPCDIGAYEKGFSPDLALEKTVNCEQVNEGGHLRFHLTVTNFGSRAHPRVQLVDRLPTGLTLLSVRASRGTCAMARGDVVCHLDGLPPDGSAHIAIDAQASIPGTLMNEAFVSGAQSERDQDNNTARATTIVVGRDTGR
jgi:uncharacterized repeat protein (TIGR01451 family)/CSLREA domain-containing protein